MEDFRKDPRTDFAPVKDLSKQEARKQAAALRDGISYHDRKYYVEADPVISDSVYDKLFARLQELEEAYPDLRTPDSPTLRVGAPPLDELESVDHLRPMLSLDAATERDEIASFDRFLREETGAESVTYTCESKFDGASVEVVFEDGRLVRGATRGDGENGEDVTENMRTIRSLPLHLAGQDPPEKLALRAEVLMRKSDFHQLNKMRAESGRDTLANPRNAAAGALRRLDSRKVADYPLDIVFYEILSITGAGPQTQWQALKRMRDWGLKTDPRARRCAGLKDVCDYHGEMAARRDDLDHEIDGIVIKLDDIAWWADLGSRQRSPRWAMAWKFAPREEVTTLADIVVQVGATGILTPVALLEPVDIGGATISRASLHNADLVAELDVRPGDRVRVKRAGDVIPEVAERVEKGDDRPGPFEMPEHCPACGSAVVREGAHTICPAGLSCPAQLRGRIERYAAREALDIEGLGERTVARLIDAGLVADLADLYDLSAEEVAELEGFADHSARALVQEIDDARAPRLDRFLFGLAIPGVGADVARRLARHVRSLEALRDADRDALQEVPDIGPAVADSVVAFFDRDENRESLEKLRRLGVSVRDMPGAEDLPLEGLTFVFTGSLNSYTRDDAERLVEEAGANAASSVSGQTDYVVVGEGAGQKREDAQEEGAEILDEAAFLDLLDKRGVER